MDVNLLGGPQGDTVHVDYTGKLEGRLGITADGGAGNDWMVSNVTLAKGSTGTLVDHLFGGQGNDILILRVQGATAHMKKIDAVITGGGGDLGVISGPVKAVNIGLS